MRQFLKEYFWSTNRQGGGAAIIHYYNANYIRLQLQWTFDSNFYTLVVQPSKFPFAEVSHYCGLANMLVFESVHTAEAYTNPHSSIPSCNQKHVAAVRMTQQPTSAASSSIFIQMIQLLQTFKMILDLLPSMQPNSSKYSQATHTIRLDASAMFDNMHHQCHAIVSRMNCRNLNLKLLYM